MARNKKIMPVVPGSVWVHDASSVAFLLPNHRANWFIIVLRRNTVTYNDKQLAVDVFDTMQRCGTEFFESTIQNYFTCVYTPEQS